MVYRYYFAKVHFSHSIFVFIHSYLTRPSEEGFKGAAWLKALFFDGFHPFPQKSNQDFIQSKNDSIKLESLIQ